MSVPTFGCCVFHSQDSGSNPIVSDDDVTQKRSMIDLQLISPLPSIVNIAQQSTSSALAVPSNCRRRHQQIQLNNHHHHCVQCWVSHSHQTKTTIIIITLHQRVWLKQWVRFFAKYFHSYSIFFLYFLVCDVVQFSYPYFTLLWCVLCIMLSEVKIVFRKEEGRGWRGEARHASVFGSQIWLLFDRKNHSGR